MWGYVKRYAGFAALAAILMLGETGMDLVQPTLMSTIVDEGVLGAGNGGVPDQNIVIRIGIVMAIAAVFGCLCGSGNCYFTNKCVMSVGNNLRKDIFSRIMSLRLADIDSFGTGSLITRTTNDIVQVQRYISTFIRSFIRAGISFAGSLLCIFYLNWIFGVITLAILPLAIAVLIICLKVATPIFKRLQQQLDQVNSIMQEDLSGIRTIKSCVRETYEKAKFGRANAALVSTQLKALLIFALLSPAMNCLMYAVIACMLLFGGYQAESGNITPGAVMAAITYITQLLASMLFLVMLSQEISRGSASWTRVKEVLNTQSELTCKSKENVPFTTARKARLGASVELCDVSFSFPHASTPVLEHLNLSVAPGQTVAFMGSTGCGKTALMQLIPRFYDVDEGCVLLDGISVDAYPRDVLRDMISVAQQRTELFSGTIAENISWGKPDATLEEIERAAGIAQADDFIKDTPEGYDTLLGQRGMSLSGGQRQRISLARAVIKPASLFIFDDATSALDLETEARFQQCLKNNFPNTTKLIVAQRISTVRNADRIILLGERGIIGDGCHDELLATNTTYQEIYGSQFGDVTDSVHTDDAHPEKGDDTP